MIISRGEYLDSNDHLKQQKIADGVGSAFHRIYTVRIPCSIDTVRESMQCLQRDPNQFSPQLLAKFEKKCGDGDCLKKDDEFQIHITGPWNGPVRVKEVAPDSFRLVTLEGHLEAGEIQFQIIPVNDNETIFEIESMARSRDLLVDFVYDKIPIAKLAQTEMWTLFCQNFAKDAIQKNGTEDAPTVEVDVLTERFDQEAGQWKKI